jgi:ABC-2 type transport system ATP-binding protein
MSVAPMIQCENLIKSFGHITALDQVSFAVGKGLSFVCLGPNGSGKSTAIRRLCGSISASVGLQIGVIPFRLRAPAFKPRIA